jgi:Putative Ig domain
VPSPDRSIPVLLPSRRRFALAILGVALVALVVVPSALAIRFTDDSYQVPNGAVGSRYFHQFKGDGGCGPALPYQFTILNGSVPPGLSLASNGVVSGTPTQQGSWSFWVELSDQDPPSASWCTPKKSQREFTINVGPRGSAPDAQMLAASVGAGFSVPNPCQLPVVGNVCDAVAGAVTKVAAEAGEFVMRGVTAWVTNAAVWVTGKVGDLVERTTSPDLTAGWFEGQYGTMVTIAGALALLMLMLAVIQAVIHQDVGLLVRSAFGYLPMAFILAGVAIAGAGLLVAITDDISRAVVSGLGTDQSNSLLQAVGDAYKNALDAGSGIPLFGVFLGAIILAIGAFVLWLELIIRDAAIYVCVFFLPLTFVAMIWPATSRWARRLVELLVAIILAKFVIVAILSLASAAITNTSVVNGDGNTFERMIAGSALLVLAAWSPFALLRLIPMMEGAAASVVGQRSTMSAAAGSAGIHTPASYMRQAMDRSARPSSPPAYPTAGGTTYARTSEEPNQSATGQSRPYASGAGAQPGQPSASGGGTIQPSTRRADEPTPESAPPGSAVATEAPSTTRTAAPAPPPSRTYPAPPAASDAPPPPPSSPAQRPRPPQPPPSDPARRPRPDLPPRDRRTPSDGGDA